jgi:hypothetical protein
MSIRKLTVIKTRDGTKNVRFPDIRLDRDAFGHPIETYDGKPLHCESGPALITESGEELYYCDGHRLTYSQYCERVKIEPHYYNAANGSLQRIWVSRRTQLPHRTDGPAIETSDGSYTAWMINGAYHRVGGPAVVISSNGGTEEAYYYNGKLHNPDGPAKTNSITNRSSYYLNNKRLSKLEFMNKTKNRSRMRGIVAKRTAYKAYCDAAALFSEELSLKAYKSGTSIETINIMNAISSLRNSEERAAAALGIYHAANFRDTMTDSEFAEAYDSLSSHDSPTIYLMDGQSDDLSPYEAYLATFFIRACEPSAVFTTAPTEKYSSMSEDSPIVRAIYRALDDRDRDMPVEYSMGEELPPDSANESSGSPEDIFSWTLPLALAAGVGMLSKLYKTKKTVEKKSVKERAWAASQKR